MKKGICQTDRDVIAIPRTPQPSIINLELSLKNIYHLNSAVFAKNMAVSQKMPERLKAPRPVSTREKKGKEKKKKEKKKKKKKKKKKEKMKEGKEREREKEREERRKRKRRKRKRKDKEKEKKKKEKKEKKKEEREEVPIMQGTKCQCCQTALFLQDPASGIMWTHDNSFLLNEW